MAVFKCKMCGGALEVEENQTVATCDYCGTQQTLPKLNDEKIANLYDRANHFRRNNEFDKAMGIYDQILNEDKSDAEAYWSIVLCRYGIEYVEDPLTRKRVPTVHRAQFTSVFDDADYKSAIQYADAYQKTIYETEAKAINEIQKGILSISQQEEPFDVFICYKETDNTGRRTPDSVLANDLYHQLTQEGFKVFFARITLEDKIGTEYEPYIFAALNSAKVMVVLGTKPEYFNAVWVKNEWSRYLSLVKNSNGKKILIPAYKDMDAYDLPEEFSHLQAQDMSKLGFMQDLIRGIKKLVQTDEPKPTVVRETVVTGGNANVDALLKRVFIFLEDKAWKDADEYCEKVLDIDPENAEAYLGKLMSELHVTLKSLLRNVEKPFDDRNNYQKVIRYGNAELKNEISGYVDYIKERNEKARLDGIYDSAKSIMLSAKNDDDYKRAAEKFRTISDYKDSAKLADECIEKGKIADLDNLYNLASITMMSASSEAKFKEAAEKFEVILDYKDSAARRDECLEKAEIARKKAEFEEKDYKLSQATRLMTKDSLGDLQWAIELLEEISGWKDADEKLAACREKYDELKVKVDAEAAQRKAEAEARRLEKERQKAAEERAVKLKALLKKLIVVIIVLGIVGGIAFAIYNSKVIVPNKKYDAAVELMEQGEYEEAISAFTEIRGYKDSAKKIDECNIAILDNKYDDAVAMIDCGDIVGAYDLLITLGGHKDSAELAESIYFDYEVIKLQNASIGDYIYWGEYEQDNNTSNGKEDVEWLILDIQDGKALVVSRYSLDAIPYHADGGSVTWATCSLRAWMNDDFISTTFSDEEKDRIPTVTVSYGGDTNSSSDVIKYIEDKVFLLSISEVEQYLGFAGRAKCTPTAYADSKGSMSWWWMRSTISWDYYGSFISDNGNVAAYGDHTSSDHIGVRPAMWIEIG